MVPSDEIIDDRPWGSDFLSRVNRLRALHPDKHKNLGMQRQCEHDLVLKVARDAKLSAYVEVGSGNGMLLRKARKELPDARVVGFELSPPQENLEKERIELHVGNIFGTNGIEPSFLSIIENVLKNSIGPVMVYTDNGHKPAELEAVSRSMRLGDICGSHDFSGPDWSGFVPFLGRRNFAIMEQYEPYILENLCLQRFWVKTDVYSGDACRLFRG